MSKQIRQQHSYHTGLTVPAGFRRVVRGYVRRDDWFFPIRGPKEFIQYAKAPHVQSSVGVEVEPELQFVIRKVAATKKKRRASK